MDYEVAEPIQGFGLPAHSVFLAIHTEIPAFRRNTVEGWYRPA